MMQQNLCNGAVSARGLCRPASRCSNHTTTRQHPRAPAAVPQPADQHNWSPAAACAAAHRAQLTPTTRCTVQRRRGGIVAACVATDAAQHDHGKQLEQQEQEAASSSSEGSSSGSESSGSSSSPLAGPAVVIKVLSEVHELEAVAKLRAEAYYADDCSRYAASFKKQFAAQEAESLRQRTSPTSSSQRPQLCECMVAVQPGSSSSTVLGCIDIRLPESTTGMQTIGVPEGDAAGAYLLNVVVAEEQRGRGVGRAVMRAAMARGMHHWGAQRLYTHVEADNEVAQRLYKGCGFAEHSSEAKYANTSTLGRLVLLMATADQAGGAPK